MSIKSNTSFWVVEKASVPLYLAECNGHWKWADIHQAIKLIDRDSALSIRTAIERLPGMDGKCAVTEHGYEDGTSGPKSDKG